MPRIRYNAFNRVIRLVVKPSALRVALMTIAAVGSWSRPVVAAESAFSIPVAAEQWRCLSSPNFELYSRVSDSESRDLLYNLETLRAVFFDRLKLQERRRLDVTVYAFRTRREFEAYMPESMGKNAELAGFYLDGKDRAVIVMAPSEDGDQARHTIFHEYVHHLFRLVEKDPPLWFNEGTAEVFAGMAIEKKRVLIGAPLETSALYLRVESMLPLREVFETDYGSSLYKDSDHAGVFYAQSWALLHFWYFGDSGFSQDSVEKFLRVAGDRQAAAAANIPKYFETCFGCNYGEMERRLKRYVHSGSYRTGEYPRPELPPAASYGARQVDGDEAARRLAELGVRVQRSSVGKLHLLQAIGREPRDPRVFETLGSVALAEDDPRTAEERWEQAIAAGSTNPAVFRELALMEGKRWLSDYDDDFQLSEEITQRLRTRLLKSIQLEPRQAASYEMLAWVEAFARLPNAENVNRVFAQIRSLPDSRHTVVALTRILLRAGRPDDAGPLLDHLLSIKVEPRDERALAQLDRRLTADFPKSPRKPVGTANAAILTDPPKKPALTMPSVGLPDDL